MFNLRKVRSAWRGWVQAVMGAGIGWSVMCHGALAQPAGGEQAAAPTVWTSSKGTEVEADFVRMTDQAVVLRLKRDGKETTVPLTALSIDSIYQAVRLAHPEGFSKPVPKAEVKPESSFELPEVNLSVDELLKSPFTSSTSLEQYFQTLDRLAQEGNFFSGWHTLPPKMQSDLEDVIIQGYQVLGPATLTQIQTLLNDLNTIARDKQQFVLGMPEVAANPQLAAELQNHWPLIAALADGLARGEHWQASNFQKGNVPRWLANLNVTVAAPLVAGMELVRSQLPPGAQLPMLSSTHNIVSQSADAAEVEVTGPDGQPTTAAFQKLGNIWINVPAMNQLRVGLDTAKEKLSAGAAQEVGMIRTTLSGIIAAVGGLARANSQEEFNQAIDLVRTIAGGLNQSLGLNGPAGGRTAAAPR